MTKPIKIFCRSGLWQTLKNIQVRAKNNFVNVENFAIMTGIIIRFETLEGAGGKKRLSPGGLEPPTFPSTNRHALTSCATHTDE